jgi:hypothetical protein
MTTSFSKQKISSIHKKSKLRETCFQIDSREKFLKDLEAIYEAALASKNLAVAIRAIELRGKELGLLNGKKKVSQKSLQEMSREELLDLLKSSS